MYTKTACMGARAVLGAVVIAGTLFAGNVSANGAQVTVSYRVTTQGLDLSQPAGAYQLYLRIHHAAWIVCTHGMRVDLEPSRDPKGCYEKALGEAIRSANLPLLTQIYLKDHTTQEAAARGINFPVQIAAK
ncbi:MAG TPA: UrcA family protein [Steroidobacteraceae bacterium]|nr:UrcA family protein [Steroidobacteraceae bacterium]